MTAHTFIRAAFYLSCDPILITPPILFPRRTHHSTIRINQQCIQKFLGLRYTLVSGAPSGQV